MFEKRNAHKDDVRLNLAIIIATYYFDSNFENRIKHIAKQADRIIIVDNSASKVIEHRLEHLVNDSCTVIKNQFNKGMAAALNQGAMLALKENFEWVLVLDQDSDIFENMIEELTTIVFTSDSNIKIGAIGSNYQSFQTGLARVNKNQAVYKTEKAVITSGTLFFLPAFKEVNGFREDFFIESVDLEYCLKIRKHGYEVLMTTKPLMNHAAGQQREKYFFGKTILLTDHLAWRYHLMVRNLFMMMPDYFIHEPVWFLKGLLNVQKLMLKILFFEKNKIRKISYMLLGIWDALLGNKRILLPSLNSKQRC